MSCEFFERQLDAYVDRELDKEAATSLRAHLARCVDCRRRVAEREALSQFVRGAPQYFAPDHLRARVSEQARRAHPSRRLLRWGAAAALVVSVGVGISLWRSAPPGDAIVDRVVDSHVRSLMSDHLFDVQSTERHTVKPWFLGKVDFSPPVVDLAAIGFPLVGGRLDYLVGRPAAALVYQRRKHTINVFVASAGDVTPATARARTVRGFHVHHWVRDGMSFWAVSDLQDSELTEFVRALQGAGQGS